MHSTNNKPQIATVYHAPLKHGVNDIQRGIKHVLYEAQGRYITYFALDMECIRGWQPLVREGASSFGGMPHMFAHSTHQAGLFLWKVHPPFPVNAFY